jgi:hypothetical protein
VTADGSPSSSFFVLLSSSLKEVHTMSRTRATVGLSLFAVLLLFPTVKAVAGPPEQRSSATQLDKVADGLRHYRQQKDDGKRVAWLKRLAPSLDPRVKRALEAALSDSSEAVAAAALDLLAEHYGLARGVPSLLPPRLLLPPLPPPRPSGPPET